MDIMILHFKNRKVLQAHNRIRVKVYSKAVVLTQVHFKDILQHGMLSIVV